METDAFFDEKRAARQHGRRPRFPYRLGFAALVLVLCAMAANAGPAADRPAETAAAAGPTALAELPFVFEKNMVVVNLPVAHYRLNLLLDTGASSSALFKSAGKSFADLEKRGKTDVILPIVDMMVPADRLKPFLVRMGTLDFRPASPLLLNRHQANGETLAFNVDGVLGQDFFRQHVVEIDPECGLLRLYSADTDLSGDFKTNVRLHMKGTAPHIHVNSRLPWEVSRTVKEMLFDTGYPGAMIVWSGDQFQLAASEETPARLIAQNRGIATFANFRVGRLFYIRAPVYISPNEPRQAQERDGLIGANILASYHYVIDFPRGRLMLARDQASGRPVDPTIYIPGDETALVKLYPPRPTAAGKGPPPQGN